MVEAQHIHSAELASSKHLDELEAEDRPAGEEVGRPLEVVGRSLDKVAVEEAAAEPSADGEAVVEVAVHN